MTINPTSPYCPTCHRDADEDAGLHAEIGKLRATNRLLLTELCGGVDEADGGLRREHLWTCAQLGVATKENNKFKAELSAATKIVEAARAWRLISERWRDDDTTMDAGYTIEMLDSILAGRCPKDV